GVSSLVDGIDTRNAGARPNLFGHSLSRRGGYPPPRGGGIGLFEHVAVPAGTAVRGEFPSPPPRSVRGSQGGLWGAPPVGRFHAFNALVLPPGDRVSYLTTKVPFITLVGSWLGLSYRWHHYSLAPSVAEHFWYNFLQSAVFFAIDPQHSPLSASIAFPL